MIMSVIVDTYILNKKRNVTCISEVCLLGMEMLFSKFCLMYKLKEVFTALKMNIMAEASKLMSEDQFDVRKGPKLKMQLKHAF